MRYIDSGSRDPKFALGKWLADILQNPAKISELRWQSGFFGATGLGLFVPTLQALAANKGLVNVLVGSNDGQTSEVDLAVLLELVGAPRANLNVGIVKFGNAYFHPKTFHIVRDDGSSTAYSGSANLTHSGVSSLHVEAGIVLDTRDGDDRAVLKDMADAIDSWFATKPAGLYPVSTHSDVKALVGARIVGSPASRHRQIISVVESSGQLVSEPLLAPLVGVPGFKIAKGPPRRPTRPIPQPRRRFSGARVNEVYAKMLTQSDAQRKQAGNQRGSITLTRGKLGDTQTYFRFDLFAAERWSTETTQTGEVLEVALIRTHVTYLGVDRGDHLVKITYAPNREEGQRNYTTLLHLGGALTDDFKAQDPTNRELTIERRTDGTYDLTIA